MGVRLCDFSRLGGYQIGDMNMNGKRFDSGIIRELNKVTGGFWELEDTGGGCQALATPAVINGELGRLFLVDENQGVDFFSHFTGYCAMWFEVGATSWDSCDWSADVDLNDCYTVEDLARRVFGLLVRPDDSVIIECFAGVI